MTDTAAIIDQYDAAFLERAPEKLVDRAVIRWRITGTENYRGVNLMRVRDGKIVGVRVRQAALAGVSSGRLRC